MDNSVLKQWPVLIIPGWQDSDENHWQSHWQRSFGWGRVVQDDWMTPKKSGWTEKLIQTIREQTSPPILVSHSLGGTAIAHAFDLEPSLAVRAAFIVAPPDLDREDTPNEICSFRPTPLKQFPFPSLLVASSNDPFSELNRSEQLARVWGSLFKCVGDRDHIGGAASLGVWKEGQDLLLNYLSGL